MRRLAVLVVLAACGGAQTHERRPHDSDGTPFGADRDFEPKAFGVEVPGPDDARPIIFTPGLGCPGDVWRETVAPLGDDSQAHVLTLSGFAGRPPISEPLSAAV